MGREREVRKTTGTVQMTVAKKDTRMPKYDD